VSVELTTPVTIHWDLPSPAAETPMLLRTCEGILACKPLVLQLRDPGPGLGAGTAALIARLADARLAVHLTVAPDAFAAAAALLPHPALRELLLLVARPEELPAAFPPPPSGDRHGETSFGVSYRVTPDNWRLLPDLVSLCRERGIARIVLPMQRLYAGEPPFLLGREEQRVLSEALVAAGGTEGCQLTIHDPFLWRAFNPGIPFPQGGCQAANTMLAVAPDGAAYPCPTLPVSLGDAGKTPLRDIALSREKRELRQRLLHSPEGCAGCGELAWCRGGCRGRSYLLHGSLGEIDPACR